MNKTLLIRTLRKIIKTKSVNLESVAAIGSCSYAEAFDVMRYLLEKDIIKEREDGEFAVTEDNAKIEEVRRENGDWKKEFSNSEIKAIMYEIDMQAFNIIRMLEDLEGKTIEELRAASKDAAIDVDATLAYLQARGLVVTDGDTYRGIIGEEDYIKMVNMFKKDKAEMKRKIDAEGERQAKAAEARKAEEEREEKELSEIIANARASQEEEPQSEESAEETPLAEDTDVSAIMSQIDDLKKKLGKKEENVAEIPLWLNAIHTTVMVKADLSDTPSAILRKLYLHYSKRGIVKKFGETNSLCRFNGDITALDKKESIFQLVFKDELVTLDWDLPIKEQINAERIKTVGEEGELAVFVFVAMQK
mgnify:CR=1 FL=1